MRVQGHLGVAGTLQRMEKATDLFISGMVQCVGSGDLASLVIVIEAEYALQSPSCSDHRPTY